MIYDDVFLKKWKHRGSGGAYITTEILPKKQAARKRKKVKLACENKDV